MSRDKCTACGGDMARADKDTSSGRDMRTDTCCQCGRDEVEDNGPALWESLGSADEAAALPAPQPAPAGFFGWLRSLFKRKP